MNGRDVGEMKRNHSFFHSNWGKFYADLPPELVRKENRVEISNPSGERFLVRDLAIMAAGDDGVERFTPVLPKMVSFGDWRGMYMGFGLVHEGCGILHSAIEYNVAPESIEEIDQYAPSAAFRLDFK